MDSNVERMVVALVYQMEALIDELVEQGVVGRDALAGRVEKLVQAANAAADEAADAMQDSTADGESE
ncbi:MAG: hypothetical protein ACYTGX_15955 [Planctomycetota bacterium]